jgi:hypothetical protein
MPENQTTINSFIRQRPYLVWSTKNYDGLSEEAIVEAVLNYGNFKDVKEMIGILGMERTAEIFRKEAIKKRCNLRPEIKNYFQLFFNKYA